jgi:hypothetical protein
MYQMNEIVPSLLHQQTTTTMPKPIKSNDNKNDQERELPHDFVPSSYSVIIGRGKKIRETVGNQRLRVIVSSFLTEYSNAKDNRAAKTKLVNKVMDLIKAACQESDCDCDSDCNCRGDIKCRRIAFVRQSQSQRSNDNGGQQQQWYEVKNSVAREKIGYIFRDLLADNYSSSSKSKIAKKTIQRQQQEARQERLLSNMSELSGLTDDLFNIPLIEYHN